MKTLGILGGMSWVSTQSYYVALNAAVQAARGRQHYADLLIASPDFQPIVAFYRKVVAKLANAGAEGVILGCTEIALLFPPAELAASPVPLYDTTALHAAMGAAWLLAP